MAPGNDDKAIPVSVARELVECLEDALRWWVDVEEDEVLARRIDLAVEDYKFALAEASRG